MIPFHRIYSWLFKSFSIAGEAKLIERLIWEWYTRMMLIKRSWIFILFVLWEPLVILLLSILSIWIAYDSIDIVEIKYTIIIGNILMSTILIVSSFIYIKHFREIHGQAHIIDDPEDLKKELELGDTYFIRFFNWSITNQFILVMIILIEIILMIILRENLGKHFWVLIADTAVVITEIVFLQRYRKRMIDLEMDFNIVVPGKIFFVNQSGVLSNMQTIESDKIKTVRSIFPSKIASFFNYGNIDILTEWDSAQLGALTMYYVTAPAEVVASIQVLLEEKKSELQSSIDNMTSTLAENQQLHIRKGNTPVWSSSRHSLDTREKIRDVLR